MRIPRKLKQINGYVVSRYGALPYENDQDKDELGLMKGIIDVAINEKKIIFRKGGAEPEFKSNVTEVERVTFQRMFEHKEMNERPAEEPVQIQRKEKRVEYIDDSRQREKGFWERVGEWLSGK